MLTPAALAELHLDLLYEIDERGLILRSRDPDIAAPLLHLVRTIEGNRWLIAASLSAHHRCGIHHALSREPAVPNIDALETQSPLRLGLAELLGRHLREYRGPAFSFPENLEPSATPTELLSDPTDVAAVHELAWIRSTSRRKQPLCVARNAAGEVVAVCHSARSTARAAEAGVETATAYRGQGLAKAVVSAWATAVRAEGRVPIYSTWWGNTASRALARRLVGSPGTELEFAL